jgi:hypothetical protein
MRRRSEGDAMAIEIEHGVPMPPRRWPGATEGKYDEYHQALRTMAAGDSFLIPVDILPPSVVSPTQKSHGTLQGLFKGELKQGIRIATRRVLAEDGDKQLIGVRVWRLE